MRFAPHTALPRAKGMHQPRDSAVLPSKQTATATAGGRRASVKQVGTDGEGRKRGEGSNLPAAPLLFRPPVRHCYRALKLPHSLPIPSPPPRNAPPIRGRRITGALTGGAVHTVRMRPPCPHPWHPPLPGSLCKKMRTSNDTKETPKETKETPSSPPTPHPTYIKRCRKLTTPHPARGGAAGGGVMGGAAAGSGAVGCGVAGGEAAGARAGRACARIYYYYTFLTYHGMSRSGQHFICAYNNDDVCEQAFLSSGRQRILLVTEILLVGGRALQ